MNLGLRILIMGFAQGRQVGYGGYGDSTPSEAMGIEFHRPQCQKT